MNPRLAAAATLLLIGAAIVGCNRGSDSGPAPVVVSTSSPGVDARTDRDADGCTKPGSNFDAYSEPDFDACPDPDTSADTQRRGARGRTRLDRARGDQRGVR